jgi:hypothetical protein
MAGARLPGQGGGMRHYLRMRAKGGTYFFTVNLANAGAIGYWWIRSGRCGTRSA